LVFHFVEDATGMRAKSNAILKSKKLPRKWRHRHGLKEPLPTVVT
jgi:hypothetical protein